MVSGIVHGDIKPENVLIFKDNMGKYTAKVTDFGYSTRFAGENDYILMPRSWPWDDPKWTSECKPAQARKMDIFSFGMLCFWVLFEKSLSGVGASPEEALSSGECVPNTSKKNASKCALEKLKKAEELVLRSQQLVAQEHDLSDSEKRELQDFFGKSLQCSSDKRADDLREAFSSLDSDR
jgi:serine/threonine protein kinase